MSDIIIPGGNGKDENKPQSAESSVKSILDVAVNNGIYSLNMHSKNLADLAFAHKLIGLEIDKMILGSQAGTPQPKKIAIPGFIAGQSMVEKLRRFRH